MKIKMSKIDDVAFTVREKIDTEYLAELKESLKEDGQWDAILVRPVGEKYEVIAGHTRIQAAKELGWKEIEATVRDLNDTDAMFLALKTNLFRQDMSDTEQGKVLQQIIQTQKISQTELSKKLGKSRTWVDQRIRLVIKLHPDVLKAVESGKITMDIASSVIASLEPAFQMPFLKYLIDNNIRDHQEAIKAKHRFLNKTIYTIGYEGKELKEFIEILKNNGVEYLMDIRFSAESTYKPDFNKTILGRELEREGIKYAHHPELGVPYEWQNPYKDGAVPVECLEKYYKWHTEKELNFPDLVAKIKVGGKTALMCMERYAKPTRDQKIHCHRHILANLIMETKEFTERIDL